MGMGAEAFSSGDSCSSSWRLLEVRDARRDFGPQFDAKISEFRPGLTTFGTALLYGVSYYRYDDRSLIIL